MSNNMIYVYCLSNNLPSTGNNIDAENLEFVKINDFYLAVRYVPESEFSEDNFKKNLSNIQWLENNAREHIKIINLIMEYGPVIPFKFGTIFKTGESLKKFITGYTASLTENLYHIEGKEEWAVKIYCNRKMLAEQIDKLSGEAAELEKQIMASPPGKAFILTRKKAVLVENEMDRLCKIYGQEYYDELKNLSEATNVNNLLPKEYTERQEDMILNANFLIKKANVDNFQNTINALEKRSSGSGFFIETTGPWPPFNFISIKEEL